MPKIFDCQVCHMTSQDFWEKKEKKAEVHVGSCAKYSLLRDWMSQIRAKVILFPKIKLRTIRLPLLYASTRVMFYFVLHHSCHLSVTTVSPSYLPFVIVNLRLFVFHPSFYSSLQIYSAPIMFRASFLGFVAGLSYCNISTFLWLDNKFIVFMILWLNYLVVLRYFT